MPAMSVWTRGLLTLVCVAALCACQKKEPDDPLAEETLELIRSRAVMNLNMPNIGAGIEQTNSTLHLAALDGDLAAVKKHVALIGTPDIFNQSCYTPLMFAAKEGHVEVVEYLISRNAYVDYYSGPLGHTALHMASFAGHADVVKVLVNNGADPQKKSALGETSLDMAKSALDSINVQKGYIDRAGVEEVIQFLEKN